jgi:exopolysaccharide production protein ExoZ
LPTFGHTPPAPGSILPIQYLRGVAALMVVWHHAAGQIPGMSSHVPWVFGTSGVDLFFVISGFIMVVTTLDSHTRPLEFWRRRIVRVVPLYWLLTLLMVGVALLAPSLFKTLKVAPETLLQSLFFVPHFSQSFPGIAWPLLVPGWTLNFEMFFYAVFGATLVLPRRARLLVLSTFFLALVGIGFLVGPFAAAPAQTYTNPMLLEFVAGTWIGAAYLSHRGRLSFGLSIVLVVAGGVLLLARDAPPMGAFAQIVGATLVVWGALHPAFGKGRSRILQSLGDSSYSLYLTHIFTLGAIRVAWARLVPSTPGMLETAVFMFMSLLICAGVGWVTYRWIEQPLLKRLSRGWKTRVTPALATQ